MDSPKMILYCSILSLFFTVYTEGKPIIGHQVSTNPCDDFDTYVCSKYGNDTFINIFDIMHSNMYSTLRILLKKTEEVESKKAKLFYRSCTNFDRIKRNSIAAFLRWKDKFINQLNSFDSIEDSKERFHKKLTFVKTNPPFHQLFLLTSEINTYNATELLPQIGPPSFYLINPFIDEENKISFAEKIHLQSKAIMMTGAFVGERISFEEILKLFKFESSIYKAWKESSEIAVDNTTISDLKKQCHVMNWTLVTDIYRQFGNVNIHSNLTIQVTSPTALLEVCKIITAHMLTYNDSRTVENYLKWSSLMAASEVVSDPILQFFRKINVQKLIEFPEHRKLRTRYPMKGSYSNKKPGKCITLTNTIFPLHMSSLYASTVPNTDFLRKEVKTLMESLKNQLKIKIANSSWLTPNDKSNIFQKIDRMTFSALYPDEAMNISHLMEHYDDLNISGSNFFENMVNAAQFIYSRNLRTIQHFGDTKIFTALEINAYYVFQLNNIFIPLGILQRDLINSKMSTAERYSKLGFILAHEIMHGFDPLGINFDSSGNLDPILSAISMIEYEKRMQCYVDQYNAYNLPGDYELSENVADSIGLEIAIKAYENESEHKNRTDIISFFVGMSTMMCPTDIKNKNKRNLVTDPHSPNKYRVVGSMSNLQRFSEIFQCDKHSKMNPIEKCALW